MATWEEEHIGLIGASEAGNCRRQITYRLLGYEPKPVTAKQQRIFDRGHALEAIIAESIEQEWGWLLRGDGNNLAFLCGVPAWLLAHPDRLRVLPGGELENVQIKAVNPTHFRYLKRGVKEQSPQYYAQVQAEMASSNLRMTNLVACDVATMEILLERIPFDEAFWVERHAELYEAWLLAMDERQLAEPEYQLPDWQCRYCGFAHHCQPGVDSYQARGSEEDIYIADDAPGFADLVAVKDRYIDLLDERDGLTAEINALSSQLTEAAEDAGVRKVSMWGLTGYHREGALRFDTAAAKKLLTPEQVVELTKRGKPSWTWRRSGSKE